MFNISKCIIHSKPIPFNFVHTIQIMIVWIRKGLAAKSGIFTVTESIISGYFL